LNWTIILIGFSASLGAGLMTGVGALPVLFHKRVSSAVEDALLGLAAGVMLAASFFSLIGPGLRFAETSLGMEPMAAAAMVLAAVLLGGAALHVMNRYVPHEHFVSGPEGPPIEKVRRIWLFVTAITLHNVPEGMAVGVGYGGGDLVAGSKLAIAIGLQNAPEGLSVALALASLGYKRLTAFLIATATGLIEGLGGLVGATVMSLAQPLLPAGLGFAAGAMLFVISNEIIPETHREGHATYATSGIMVGVVVMTFLDTSLR
jgi:ZIP family zinc transporter